MHIGAYAFPVKSDRAVATGNFVWFRRQALLY